MVHELHSKPQRRVNNENQRILLQPTSRHVHAPVHRLHNRRNIRQLLRSTTSDPIRSNPKTHTLERRTHENHQEHRNIRMGNARAIRIPAMCKHPVCNDRRSVIRRYALRGRMLNYRSRATRTARTSNLYEIQITHSRVPRRETS